MHVHLRFGGSGELQSSILGSLMVLDVRARCGRGFNRVVDESEGDGVTV